MQFMENYPKSASTSWGEKILASSVKGNVRPRIGWLASGAWMFGPRMLTVQDKEK